MYRLYTKLIIKLDRRDVLMAKKLGWKGDPHSINVALSVNDTITRPIALSESQA